MKHRVKTPRNDFKNCHVSHLAQFMQIIINEF
jgi:hypothetical protein